VTSAEPTSVEIPVERLLIDLLDLQEPIDWSTVRYQDTEGWDSLVHMALVTELESIFGVTLSDDDIMTMDDLAGVVAVLTAHGVTGSQA
jgi:acyl carrier protein